MLFLTQKLEHLGIKGDLLLWISNYLHDRNQKTFANVIISKSLPITCGVPQGSILGPLFFNAYINDMKKYIETNKLGLYADDTVIFSHATDLIWLQNDLQVTLNKFQKWCNMNALTINIQKTKFIIFGTRSKVKKAKIFKLKTNEQSLLQVPTYKYLGVTIDFVLSYSKHISTIIHTVSHKAYILSKIRRFITLYSSIRIYKSMILPYFDYADIVYDKANCTELEKLQRLQNRCIKTCLCADKRTNTDLIHSIAKTP